MEPFLECYLEGLKDTPRNSLHDRRHRKQMVEYINTLIQGCSGANNGDTELTCKEAINTLIQHHDKTKNGNGKVCIMGKYHNILYVAVKLCYLWQLRDADLVCRLLKEIYLCEQTFERILIGAIFGTKAPHYIAGWKSDFENQEENLRGVVYFLDKANHGKLELPLTWGNQLSYYRFVDLPIESCAKASALKLCVQLGLPDKLQMLLRFGASIADEADETSHFKYIMNKLMEFNHCYPYNLVACLQLLLRAVPAIKVHVFGLNDCQLPVLLKQKYSDLVEDGLISASRCGLTPPEMKHLCRCVIRRQLWKNFALPHEIRKLPLPEKLRRYVDILED